MESEIVCTVGCGSVSDFLRCDGTAARDWRQCLHFAVCRHILSRCSHFQLQYSAIVFSRLRGDGVSDATLQLHCRRNIVVVVERIPVASYSHCAHVANTHTERILPPSPCGAFFGALVHRFPSFGSCLDGEIGIENNISRRCGIACPHGANAEQGKSCHCQPFL